MFSSTSAPGAPTARMGPVQVKQVAKLKKDWILFIWRGEQLPCPAFPLTQHLIICSAQEWCAYLISLSFGRTVTGQRQKKGTSWSRTEKLHKLHSNGGHRTRAHSTRTQTAHPAPLGYQAPPESSPDWGRMSPCGTRADYPCWLSS